MFSRFRSSAVGLAALATVSLLGCSGKDSPSRQEEADPGFGADGELSSTLNAPLPASSDSLRTEYMALQQRLGGLQRQALQDSVLQRSYAALDAMVQQQMEAVDPQLGEHRERLSAIQQEIGAAQQSGQEEKVRELIEEGTSLQNRLDDTRQRTLAREEVTTAFNTFRDEVVAKMTEIDPEVPVIVERANAMAERLQAEAAGSPPPPASEPEGTRDP